MALAGRTAMITGGRSGMGLPGGGEAAEKKMVKLFGSLDILLNCL